MFKTLLFDVDGTIIDTENVMIRSLQKTLFEELNKKIPVEDLNYILGIPGREAISQFFYDNKEADIFMDKWKKNVSMSFESVQIFSGMKDTLYELYSKGIKLGIVTSKTNDEMREEFDIFGLNHYFNVFVTASDTDLHKPFPNPIQKAIEILNVEKNDVIYIGDSVYDMQSAKSCGIRFGLAAWGAIENIKFKEADFILNNPKEILSLLDGPGVS